MAKLEEWMVDELVKWSGDSDRFYPAKASKIADAIESALDAEPVGCVTKSNHHIAIDIDRAFLANLTNEDFVHLYLHPPQDREALERDHRAMERLREHGGALASYTTEEGRRWTLASSKGWADPADAILGKEE